MDAQAAVGTWRGITTIIVCFAVFLTGDGVIEHFADRLLDSCRRKGAPICVGIDPVYERLPEALRGDTSADVGAVEAVKRISAYVEGVLEATAPHVPCVKFQSACFERYLWVGVEAYHRLVARARELGLIVIGDAKRGDISISAAHYAAGCLADSSYVDLGKIRGPDALTVNAYLGADSLEPMIEVARAQGKGLFALVRTSNPGGDALQGLKLSDGRTVADAVAGMIAELGSSQTGSCGYSLLGAVVGATKSEDAARLRALMPRQIFLVPGFGAQGAGADDVRACFNPDGAGALITASRSVLYAYDKKPGRDWRKAVEAAAMEMKEQIRAILS